MGSLWPKASKCLGVVPTAGLMMRPATLLSIEQAMKAFCFAISSPESPNITDQPRAQKTRSTAARIAENTGLQIVCKHTAAVRDVCVLRSAACRL